MTRQVTKGRCAYCDRDFANSGMSRHLQSCSARQQALAATQAAAGVTQTLYHLMVRDAASPLFWLHLEMRGAAKLEDLDAYLRAIWLECCGHLSNFAFKGSYDELPMGRRVDKLFEPGLELLHTYDYGTTSETLVKVVSARRGKPTTEHPIALMARNLIPEVVCIQCGAPAAFLCQECIYEDNTSGLLCAEHAKNHPHEDYGEPIALVNSPRLGMCGYTGPADPPY